MLLWLLLLLLLLAASPASATRPAPWAAAAPEVEKRARGDTASIVLGMRECRGVGRGGSVRKCDAAPPRRA